MATTLLLWPDKTGDDRPPEKEKQDAAAVPPRLKNRKGGRTAANAPKKQPQRGLGVAQLERLRLQEQRRKMLAEAELMQGQQAASALQYSFPYADGRSCPGAGVMAPRLAHPAYSGAGSCDNPPSLAAMQRYRIVSSVRPPLFSDGAERFLGVGVGADPRLHNVFQATPEKMKELSSNQNLTCWSDQCETCNKRRKPQYENHGFVKEGRQGGKWTDGCDLLRLGLWTSQAADLERIDRETMAVKRGERHAHFAMDVDEAVERKGKEVNEGRMWEYEFFPAKNGGSEGEVKDVMAVGEPSASGIGSYAPSSASASLDLSLKLFSC
ncbi:hypothetical protein EJ110_NYTH34737 [Nymphaea thermarum]|nr:hypothetical protein EJ110_NYTH34737 [Nymphaea thermarum]